MNTNRRHAVAALIAAGLLWGTTVPLSKLALEWLSPGWLTVVRFGLAAAVLLAAALLTTGRARLRAAFTPAVLVAGAVGYGGSVMVQNAGILRTSVTHAALLIGAVPVLVAIIAAAWHRTVARPVAWFGFVVSLGGVGLVAGGGGGGATLAGDGLVLVSLLLSATVTVAQGALLAGRDPVAVTAVQFMGAALGALPVALCTSGAPAAPGGPGPVLAVAALAAAGTLLPFTLFAFGQSRVSAEVAGAFLNLEPLVGAIAGAAAFGDPVGLAQVAGGAAILAGIGLSSLPLLAGRVTSRRVAAGAGASAGAGAASAEAPGAVGAASAVVGVVRVVGAVGAIGAVGATALGHSGGGLTNRGVLDESPHHQARSARRLVIEAVSALKACSPTPLCHRSVREQLHHRGRRAAGLGPVRACARTVPAPPGLPPPLSRLPHEPRAPARNRDGPQPAAANRKDGTSVLPQRPRCSIVAVRPGASRTSAARVRRDGGLGAQAERHPTGSIEAVA